MNQPKCASYHRAVYNRVAVLGCPGDLAVRRIRNDLLVVLIFRGNQVPVPICRLSQRVASPGGWHPRSAFANTSMAVPVLNCLAVQRCIVRGLLAGFVEG